MSTDPTPSPSVISKIIASAEPGIFAITGAAGSGKSFAGKHLAKQEQLALYSILVDQVDPLLRKLDSSKAASDYKWRIQL